ncbi:MAG: alpha/beta hydrolase-fold protein [Dehalococcoidia bacterium]
MERRRDVPAADVQVSSGVRRSIPTRLLLLGVAVILLTAGFLFGEPVAPPAGLPEIGVSPIVRRSIREALQSPRQESPLQNLDPPRARGTIVEDVFWSDSLDREMPYAVYLPPGYETSGQHYPVLYALHGLAGYYAEWVDFGATDVADSLFSNSKVPPFIIVFPQGDQSYWFNHPQGGDAWADYVTNEIVPLIDGRYRTIPRRVGRAIGGLSMGATGALQIALRRPDLFAVVGAHSPSFRTTPDADVFWFFSDPIYYRQYDPFVLVQTLRSAERLRIWLDVGDVDPWRETVEQFDALLTSRGVAHRFTIGEGDHEGTYWAQRMPDYLTFYGYALVNPSGAGEGSVNPVSTVPTRVPN